MGKGCLDLLGKKVVWWLLILPLFFIGSVQAQVVVPDAGAVKQQIEREQDQFLQQQKSKLPEQLEEKELAKLPGPTLTVKQFGFSGNTLIKDEHLQEVVKPYLEHPVTFSELQEAARKVAEAYRDSGWIVRTFLPQQDVSDGIVIIRVVEAVFGEASLQKGDPEKPIEHRVLKIVQHAQPQGEHLSTAAINRALLLANDLPGVLVSGSLQKGKALNETDLVLSTVEEPAETGVVLVDNAGSLSTGEQRLVGRIKANVPGWAQQLVADLQTSKGLRYFGLGFSQAVGYDGLVLGAKASVLDYDLVSNRLRSLDGNGKSTSIGVNLRYPIVRSADLNVNFTSALERNQYENFANSQVASRYQVNRLQAGVDVSHMDAKRNAVNNAGVTATYGNVDLSSLDVSENADRDGTYGKLRYYLSRHQKLRQNLSIYGSLNGQYANNEKLDSSERFYLGGATGVRAYPGSEAGGSDAQLLSLELRWLPVSQTVVTGFYDWGRALVEQSAVPVGDSNDVVLQGVGVSVSRSFKDGLNLSATVAHRIGDNPLALNSGSDQDGSKEMFRWWLSASWSF